MRVGDFTKSIVFDGNMVQWYHVECFMNHKYVPDFRCVDNMWKLRWKDQMEFKKAVEEQHIHFLEDYKDQLPVSKSSLLKKRVTRPSDVGEDDPPMKKKKLSESPNYTSMRVPELKKELNSRSLSTKGRKTELIARLEAAEKVNDDGQSSDGDEMGEDKGNDKVLFNFIDNEDAIKEENIMMWAIRDAMKEEYFSFDDMKSLLEDNGMSTAGNYENLQNRIVFGLLYGKPMKCPACNDGFFRWKGDEYHCVDGNTSAWAKCQNIISTEKFKCKPFIVSEKILQEHPFMKKYSTPKIPVKRVVFRWESEIRVRTFKQELKVSFYYFI